MEVRPGDIVTVKPADNETRVYVLSEEGDRVHMLDGEEILINKDDKLLVLYVNGHNEDFESFMRADGYDDASPLFLVRKVLVLLPERRLGWIWSNWIGSVLVRL